MKSDRKVFGCEIGVYRTRRQLRWLWVIFSIRKIQWRRSRNSFSSENLWQECQCATFFSFQTWERNSRQQTEWLKNIIITASSSSYFSFFSIFSPSVESVVFSFSTHTSVLVWACCVTIESPVVLAESFIVGVTKSCVPFSHQPIRHDQMKPSQYVDLRGAWWQL